MKTNIFRYAISLAAVFAAIVSCDKKQPEEEQKGPEKVDPIFPSSVVNETVKAGQSVDLKFEPNMEWKVEISGEGKGNIFWIDDAGMKATSVSSKETGPQVVTIEFSENEEFDKNRVCDVTLSMGGESKKIATYTRPSLGRTFEVYAGVPGEFGFDKVAGAYAYTGTEVSEASLTTFPGEVTYVLPMKVVTNYSWQLILPSWASSEVISGNAGTTEILLNAVLTEDLADGAEDVVRFADASNPEASFEVKLSMPAFRDRVECNLATTFNFDVNGLVENLNGSFIEIPAFFELLSTPQTQVKVVDWYEKGQYYGTSFSEWPEVTKTLYDNQDENDLLAKYTVEFKVGANETYDDKYADVFVVPASKASVALEDWFDAATGNLKDEFKSFIVGRLYQPGIERDYITLSETDEVYEAELAKYTESQWWASNLATENIFELVYKDEYSDAVLVFDEPFASFKYFDYDFIEVPEEETEDFWLSFNGFASNGKGRVAMYPEKFTRSDAQFPESFIVFYDEDGRVMGAMSCRYTKKASVITGDILSLAAGEAEFVKLDDEDEMKAFLASEYGQMGVLDVYRLTTSERNVSLSSQIEAWGHKILKVEANPPYPEYTDAPFSFENMATSFDIYMGQDVTDRIESVILLQEPGADGETLLNFAAVHYIFDPAASDEDPENPGEDPDLPVEDPEFDETSPMAYSIGAGSGNLVKYGTGSDRYKAVNAKYGITEVYHLTSGDRMVYLKGTEELYGILQLDPATLEESAGTDALTFEGSDSGFNIYLRGAENAEALVLVEGAAGYFAAVYVTYDYSMGIPSPFEFTNPSAVEGKATLARCEGEILETLLVEFTPNANFDERNIYQLTYSDTSVSTEITIPSAPVDNAAWNNYPVSSKYWLTCKVSGMKMTVTMTKSGLTDYFVFRTTDGNWAWILVCTCE